MEEMKKVTASIIFAILVIIILLFPSKSLALAKFNTSYQIYYLVEPSGNTHVAFTIKQTNNLSVVYATDYGISINETKISNIKVSDEGVPVKPDVIKTLNQTSISFPFANKVVGKDKVHSFVIEYDTADITSKFGNTWQINIPRLEADENVSDQTAILTIPAGFPAPAYIDPKPDTVNGNNYYFSSKNLSNKSISAIFGVTQYYQGKLVYHLTNNSQDKIFTEIALPPNTSYQTTYIEKIDPKPVSITKDLDGNLLAKYLLESHQNIDITANIYFKINFHPVSTSDPVSEKYLLPNEVWNFTNNIFSVPELSNLKTPRSVYDYVSDKLSYDYEKINKKVIGVVTASDSLRNNKSAICTDFTNVFVTLARKVGIPAREIEGFAISDNPDLKPLSLTHDVLHAWPEYFDKTRSTWIQVDPTWTNTTRGVDYFNKLDFNHIAFVIHGASPTYPIPAGGYKYGSTNTKDISIEPIQSMKFPSPILNVNFSKQDKDLLIFNIQNTTGVAFVGSANIASNETIQGGNQAVDIPPYSNKEITAKLNKSPFIGKNDIQAIININGEQFTKSVSIVSTRNQVVFYSTVGGVLGISSIIAWCVHLRRRKQKSSIYR